MNPSEEQLYLENQLCFPLYAASRLVTKLYSPLLKKIGLTYPQYLILLVLWEADQQTVSALSELLYLESNTLTPLLKRMEKKALIKRERSTIDERKVIISLTKEGNQLREEAFCIPELLISQFQDSGMALEEALQFKNSLNKLLKLLGQKE